jgi:hypothetical protein
MMKYLIRASLILICYTGIVKADDGSSIKDFLYSCYLLPCDPKTEMTDIVLVNSYYNADQSQIKDIAGKVIAKYADNPNLIDRNDMLDDIFKMSSMNNNAVIQFFRERAVGGYYRLDMAMNLKTFTQYSWDNGKFTNEHRLYINKISVPPMRTNGLWTLYTAQPAYSEVDIESGEAPLLYNEGFYLNAYGLPPGIKLAVIMQTADAKKGLGGHVSSNNDPTGFSYFTPSEKRVGEAIDGKGKYGGWTIKTLGGGVKQLSLISPDGVDHDLIHVLINATNIQKKYLAYVRSSDTGKIYNLFAWDYDENGSPVRFIRIESGRDGNLKCWAQYIIHLEKTKNKDWSLFNINLSNYSNIYDKRPQNPIETVNGKVVFDAGKDKYSPLPAMVGNVRSSWFDKTTIIRTIIFTLILPPPLVLLFVAIKKRISK